MADRTLDGLRACVSSLRTIVAPAVELSGDKLAREQTRLIAKYLDFLIERLDHAEDRSRYELDRYVEIAEAVATLLASRDLRDDELDGALASGRQVLGRTAAAKPALESATARIQSALSRIVRAMGEQSHPLRAGIEKAVMEGSRAVVSLQRAWFAPQGWEPKGSAPDIDILLGSNAGYGHEPSRPVMRQGGAVGPEREG